MATNFYFNNIGASQEQLLIEDLIIESIKIHGVDVYYIPRTLHNRDVVYREGEYYSFDSAISVEMYIKNTMGMEGEGEFLSKFGIQVLDQITFTMAQRVFGEEVGDFIGKERPFEGDLIYFPLTQAVYQIKFVNKKAIFYQLGALQTYDITCELFAYNNEEFNCGIPYIDDRYNALSTNMGDDAILTENNYILTTESDFQLSLESFRLATIDVQAQNEEFEDEALDFLDFTEIDPFSEGTRQ